MTRRLIAVALAPLLLATAAGAQTFTCTVQMLERVERDAEGAWGVGPRTDASLSFTLVAAEGCATPGSGDCTGSVAIAELPGETFPCEATGPAGTGLACPVEGVSTIWAHPGSGAFAILEVEHLVEGRRNADVTLGAGSCAPA